MVNFEQQGKFMSVLKSRQWDTLLHRIFKFLTVIVVVVVMNSVISVIYNGLLT